MSELTESLNKWNKKYGKHVKWTKVAYSIGVDGKALSSYTRGRNIQEKDEMQVEMFLHEYPMEPKFAHFTDEEITAFIKSSFVNVRGISIKIGMGNKLSQFMCVDKDGNRARVIPVKRRYEVIRELSRWGLR